MSVWIMASLTPWPSCTTSRLPMVDEKPREPHCISRHEQQVEVVSLSWKPPWSIAFMSNFGTKKLNLSTDMWDSFTSTTLPKDPSFRYSDNSMDKSAWFMLGKSGYYED